MLRLILTAVLAVLCCAPASAEPPRKPPVCPTLEYTRMRASQIAEQFGGGALAFDGDEAHRFLSEINAWGEPTSWTSDHIGVMVLPSQGVGILVMATKDCGYGPLAVRMPLPLIYRAYKAAKGEGA